MGKQRTRVLRFKVLRGLVQGVVSVALLMTLPGCSALLSPPSVTIVGVDLVSMGLAAGTAEVTLEVSNERSGKLDIRGFFYELEVRDGGSTGSPDHGWHRLADGVHGERVVIEGRQVHRVILPVPFEYRALGAALRSFLLAGEVHYRVRGEVRVRSLGSERKVPFRSQGVLRP